MGEGHESLGDGGRGEKMVAKVFELLFNTGL